MKILRYTIAAIAIAGSVSAFATSARVESMGKSSRYIMDDISIFDNPANINLYPNFLIGELGSYVGAEVERGKNQDPFDPWFGGIFALNISEKNSLSIAGVMGRKDERLLKYFPEYLTTSATGNLSIKTPEPVTNFDGFLGANFGNKAFGLHIYVAHQDGLTDEGKMNSDAFVSALQLDAGTNIEISSGNSFELSFGAARLQYGPRSRDFFEPELFSGFGSARYFHRIDAINGHIIPSVAVSRMRAPGRDELDISLGSGVDAAFDRGFFWLGVTGFYNDQRAGSSWQLAEDGDGNWHSQYRDLGSGDNNGWGRGERTEMWQAGGTINFGIERNIWWDWFVLRVGGQKTIAYTDYSKGENNSVLCPEKKGTCNTDGSFFKTNAINDGTREDNVGFGFGINIEEKLKLDAVVAEDLVFRNPFQGGGRLFSKISATYSF